MKHHITLILSVVAVAASTVVIMTSGTADTPPASTPYAVVISPDTPDKITLCGQEIDLTRTDMWERFDREITTLAYGHSGTMLTLKRANKYFPIMAPILEKNGVPLDILYLAVTESNLDLRALSPAKAAGVWQFMASTAPEFGMEVNDEVDERYNLEKATEGACRYLKQAYAKYGDWPTVMASYNAGQGRISGEMSSQGVNKALDLYLVPETSRYAFRIMAWKVLMEQPRTFGYRLKADQLYQPVEYKRVDVTGPVASWPQWAKNQGISYAQLVEANPWIRAKKLTNARGKKYTVLVPEKESLTRNKKNQKVYNKAWVE